MKYRIDKRNKSGLFKTVLASAAVLLLGACSQDVVDSPDAAGGTPVRFSAQSSEMTTRAGVNAITPDNGKFTNFGVFAAYSGKYKYDFSTVKSNFMFNQKVETNDGGTTWSYEPIKFWPNEDLAYTSFFAYAPYVAEPNGEGCIAAFNYNFEEGDPWLVYKLAPVYTNQVDLLYGINADTGKPWYDVTKPAVSTDPAVYFTFNHALACAGSKMTIRLTDKFADAMAVSNSKVYVDSVVIDYTDMTSKAQLSLNSADGANWKTIVSGDLQTKRRVVIEHAIIPDTLRATDIDNSETYTERYNAVGNGLTTTEQPVFDGETLDRGFFYIPHLVDTQTPQIQKAVVTVYFQIVTPKGDDMHHYATRAKLTGYTELPNEEGKSVNLNLILDLVALNVSATIIDWKDTTPTDATSYVGYERPMVGDYYYSDGTTSHEYDASKTPVGIVMYVGNDPDITEGMGHGLVMSLKYAQGQGGLAPLGRDMVSLYPDDFISVNEVNMAYDFKGLEKTDDFIAAGTVNPQAPYRLKLFRDEHPKAIGASDWFLPSIGQICAIINACGGVVSPFAFNSPLMFIDNEVNNMQDVFDNAVRKIPDVTLWNTWTNNNIRTSSVTVSDTGEPMAVVFYLADRVHIYKRAINSNANIRPVFAF